MKKTIALAAVLGFGWAFGQSSVSDYQFIYLPKELPSKISDYQLDAILVKNLENHQYKVIQEDPINWPMELKENPCKVLNASLQDDSSFFRNKLKLEFSDCNKTIISTLKASSMEKEFKEGFQDALHQIVAKVPASNPSASITLAEKKVVPAQKLTPALQNKVEKVQAEDRKLTKMPSSDAQEQKVTSGAQQYEYKGTKYNKINLSNEEFILVAASASVPYANFKQTGKQGVYRVKLNSGASGISYEEAGALVIELNNEEQPIKLNKVGAQ
ncbi:hypothetical protein [Elizabethkingia sp. JS20170427COW]|uniref:hypothetical protein n=1 Tax=Elizabethkingia sp. JS20170427COW TaxID=2583851 RepID=UPI0011104F25|nr:hypothetical protein [Elizabethkingia sp. JS20170427COW]QCX53487.1 hypothetical protein FGE20_06940 [Elizabethkingia sp. JS20170427COW]